LTKIKVPAPDTFDSQVGKRVGAAMELQLFVSRTFAPCRDAERVWREVAREHRVGLTVVDVHSPGGGDRDGRLPVTVVPAIAADGRLLAIGVQTIEEARRLIAAAARG
jgi:hypothetical protein